MADKRESEGSISKKYSSVQTFVGDIKTDAKLVIGIDFGTTYSGIAYVYRDNPTYVHCGAPSRKSQSNRDAVKVPTVLCKGEDGSWSFGFDALQDYTEALENGTFKDAVRSESTPSREPLLFRRFKMVLKDRQRGAFESHMALSTSGKSHSLLDLVKRSLEYLSQFALRQVRDSWAGLMGLEDDDIRWVITVPAIWTDYAKAFMRRAAFEAGLISDEASDRLLLALEPESASLSIQEEASRLGLFNAGATFMILDCGGGTVDVTTHKVSNAEPLELIEIASPVGGAWGGEYVDSEFRSFLELLFGRRVLKELEERLPTEFHEVMENFREMKESFDPEKAESSQEGRLDLSKIFLRSDIAREMNLPTLEELVEAFNKKRLHSPFDISSSQTRRKFSKGILTFSRSQVKTIFFEPTLAKICEVVHRVLEQNSEIENIVLVGGYGSSKVLKARIAAEFSQKTVTVPESPQAAVVQGATYFGLYTATIRSRVARFTYGVESNRRWVDGCGFPESAAHYDAKLKEKRVKDVFNIMVRSGEEIPADRPLRRTGHTPLYPDQHNICFPVYKSKGKEPKRTSEDGCEKLGEITVKCRGPNDRFDIKLTFTTELRVETIRQEDGDSHFEIIRMV